MLCCKLVVQNISNSIYIISEFDTQDPIVPKAEVIAVN